VRVRSLWWVPAFAATALLSLRDLGADGGDAVFFAHTGERFYSSGWADLYSDPTVQTGPLKLIALGWLGKLSEATGLPLHGVLAVVVELAGIALFLYVLKRILPGRSWWVPLSGGLAAVALGLPQSAWVDGHPAQLIVPLLWVLAALEARDGFARKAGILIGVSMGLQLWGVLGLCVLLLSPKRREAGSAAATAVALGAAWFLPFVVFGDFRMFDFHWSVADHTVVSLFLDPGTAYPWALRIVQAAASIGAGCGIVWALRRRPEAIWLGPLVAVLVRFAFDPVFYASYLLAPLTLVVLGATQVLSGDLVRGARAARSARRNSGQGVVAIRR
jgi:hypothetical protein